MAGLLALVRGQRIRTERRNVYAVATIFCAAGAFSAITQIDFTVPVLIIIGTLLILWIIKIGLVALFSEKERIDPKENNNGTVRMARLPAETDNRAIEP